MDEKSFDGINIIPLVDVMLVLLTIVLTTSTFIAVGALPVELPEAKNSEASIKTETSIEIDKTGRIFINQQQVDIEKLSLCLTRLERSTPILIRADRAISLAVFVEVMDLLKGMGFQKISLQTEKTA